MQRHAEQVIAPKRETAIFLFGLRVKSYLVAGGFALGELRRSVSSGESQQTYLLNSSCG